jgi:hypothetical protein
MLTALDFRCFLGGFEGVLSQFGWLRRAQDIPGFCSIGRSSMGDKQKLVLA